MNTRADLVRTADTSTKLMASTSEMIFALKSLKPSGRSQKAARFAELIDVVEELLARDVYQKDIIVMLAKNGLSLSPATFKQYLDAARRHREAKNAFTAVQPDDSPIQSAIDSEPLRTGEGTVQADEGVEYVDAENASEPQAPRAKGQVPGGVA